MFVGFSPSTDTHIPHIHVFRWLCIAGWLAMAWSTSCFYDFHFLEGHRIR